MPPTDAPIDEATQQHLDAIEQIRRNRIDAARAKGLPTVGGDGLATGVIAGPATPQHVIDRARAAGAFDDDTVPSNEPKFTTTPADDVAESPDDESLDEVPEQDVPGLKAMAAKRGVGDELRRVTIDGVSHEVIVRKPTLAEWNEYINAALVPDQSSSGEWSLMVQCALWPSLARVKASSADKPAMVKQIVDVIERWVGGDQSQRERVKIELSSATTEDELREIGLTLEEVQRLLTRYSGKKQLVALSLTTSPPDTEDAERDIVTVVVKRPPQAIYQKLVTGWRSADKAQAVYDAALSCIVNPEEESERRALLKTSPGLPWSLFPILMQMGGAGDRVRAGKL